MNHFPINDFVTGNILIRAANRQHLIDVALAEHQLDVRESRRVERYRKRTKALDTALLIASIVGTITAAGFLCAIRAG